MRYVYNVIYYTYGSLYCRQEYENEIFSSCKKAKKFISKIVEEENRSKNDQGFYFYKIKLIKKEINTLEENKEAQIYIFDLEGKLLYDSFDKLSVDDRFTRKFHVGDAVRIIPFPWSVESCCEIEMFGIVAGHYREEYLVYVIDNYKVLHLHIKEASLEYVDIKDKRIEPLLKNMHIVLKGKENTVPEEAFRVIHALKFFDPVS